MEVRLILLAIICALSIACEKKKTTADVASYKNGEQNTGACPAENLVKNRFVVKYEDGRVEVVEAENESVFEKYFLEPNLQLIKRVEYDSIVTLDQPEDRDYETFAVGDFGNQLIKAEFAWQQGVEGQGVTVAVLDTAVESAHPQLSGQVARDPEGKDLGWDFIRNTEPVAISDPELDHGSHVAGIILADPKKGPMSGVAPKAKFIQASFIDESHGSMGTAIQAIQYAAQKGARIINASWGGSECSATLKETIAEVGSKGVLFVAASGNDGIDYDFFPRYSYPAVFNLPNMITVAATDAADRLTAYSNRSFYLVQIGAPGDGIRSTVPLASSSNGYRVLSGTSMAAPFVSGTAALLWSAKPNATVTQIRQAILSSTDFKSYKVSTQGRLNVEKALTEIRRVVP
jgi:subtilisin family serine protease